MSRPSLTHVFAWALVLPSWPYRLGQTAGPEHGGRCRATWAWGHRTQQSLQMPHQPAL